MADIHDYIHEVWINEEHLERANRIYLSKGKGYPPVAFDIVYNRSKKSIQEMQGSSCVCYDAYMLGSSGKLKEFYPIGSTQNIYALSRRKSDNVLCTNPNLHAASQRFFNDRQEFIDSYNNLQRWIENDSSDMPVLKTFIPDFDIYYSAAPNGELIENGTVYIWTSNKPMLTFEDYLKKVRSELTDSPEHKLFVILNTVLNLTECIHIMHQKGLLHLDIKPSNFGFTIRNDKLLYSEICLFDTNSFLPIGQKAASIHASEEYNTLENINNPQNQSDIYSIGATLFEAIVIHDEAPSSGFDKDLYPDIPRLVAESKLIQASNNNSDITLVNMLVDILKSCLNDYQRNRPTAEELIEKLKKAITRLIPSEYNLNIYDGKPITNEDIDALRKQLDKKTQSNMRLIMQQHLYEHPLYEYSHRTPDQLHIRQDLRVLIVGFGNFGQQFLDAALPLSMMYHTDVQFYVVSNQIDHPKKAGDNGFYLNSRPALWDFININNCTDPQKYGLIRFEPIEFQKENSALLAEKMLTEIQPHYIFIALGDDKLNRQMAREWAELTQTCSINFVVQNENSDINLACSNMHPVYVYSNPKENPNFKALEQMAYGCHMLWNSSSNENPITIRRKFLQDETNYLSSIANAVSIPYKLAGVGIIESNPSRAAEQYDAIVNCEQNRNVKNEMIACEQHRWTLDKICRERYTCLRDYDEAVRLSIKNVRVHSKNKKFRIEPGKVYDSKTKRHICIVRSTASQDLLRVQDWDAAEIPFQLDEHDMVSVELHRAYKREADKLRQKELLTGDTVKRIQKLIADHPEAQAAFDEWFRILTFIWHNQKSYVKQYDDLKNKFLDSLKVFDTHLTMELLNLTVTLHSQFYPICQSLAYTNYKQYDSDMVEKVPFMLTYSDHIHIVVPLLLGSNTMLFKNIAQSVVINPYKITYICRIDGEQDFDPIKNAIVFILNMIKAKDLKTKINLVFILRTNNSALADKLNRLSEIGSAIVSTRILICQDHEIPERVQQLLESRAYAVSAVEYNENYPKLFPQCSCISQYPTYTFDTEKRCFSSFNTGSSKEEISEDPSDYRFDCRHLTYYNNSKHLTVNDVFGSIQVTGKAQNNIDLFRDYADIFNNICQPDSVTWETICRKLSEYTQKQDKLAAFPCSPENSSVSVEQYILPAFICQTVELIMHRLREEHIVSPNTKVLAFNSDSIQVIIEASAAVLQEMKKLFADPYRLVDTASVLFRSDASVLSIYMNGLIVKDFPVMPHEYEILRALEKRSLLYNLYCNTGTDIPDSGASCSFVISSYQIKEILTHEDRLLKLYCYSQLVGNKNFHDVVTSCAIDPDSDENTGNDSVFPKTAFDIIVTRGFKMLFIECITSADILQRRYHDLQALCGKYGIQPTAVIISAPDTEADIPAADMCSPKEGSGNSDEIKIITVNKISDIRNLSDTLLKIFDGSYPC